MKFLYYVKLLVINTIILAVLAGMFEVLARAIYPEFTDLTFSDELSLGKASDTGRYRGFNRRISGT